MEGIHLNYVALKIEQKCEGSGKLIFVLAMATFNSDCIEDLAHKFF